MAALTDGHPLLHIKRDQFTVFALSETFGEFLTDYLINVAFCLVHNVQQACTSFLESHSSTPKTCIVSSFVFWSLGQRSQAISHNVRIM